MGVVPGLEKAMRRRDFVKVIGGTAGAWPLAARAQQRQRPARIGYLAATSPAFHKPYGDAFREGLRDLGYVEGKNIIIEARFANGDNDVLPALAAELVGLDPDVIVTYATGINAVQRATSTIPIVMATQGDAVASGIVASLSHPGGNVTGSTFFNPELMSKRLELMKEAIPSMNRSGVLLMGDSPLNGLILREIGATAKALRLELQTFEMRKASELESAFLAWANNQIGGLVVTDHGILLSNMRLIVSLAAKHRIPSIGALELARNNGLLAYGVDFFAQFRRAGAFVDKVLRGVKPRDIPVEQATKFITIANIRTAKSFGIELPTSILLRADEVIE
jgi:putative ABC transport system substrate-binding protein